MVILFEVNINVNKVTLHCLQSGLLFPNLSGNLNPISAGVLENQDKKFANLQKLNFLSQNPVKSSKNVCKKNFKYAKIFAIF